MKRTKAITLILLASTVTACNENGAADEVNVFRSMNECTKMFDSASCSEFERAAEKEHRETAPKYASREECERTHGDGQCVLPNSQSYHSGEVSNSFIPMMLGYMVGSTLSNGTNVPSAPIYSERDRTGGASSPIVQRSRGLDVTNYKVNNNRPVSTTARSSTVSRGGFGSIGGAKGAAS